MFAIIKHEFPPNYDAIAAAFDLKGYRPIFAFAPDIYDPHRSGVPAELLAHEEVHIKRQGNFPSKWWEQYITDENFRVTEELMSHVAEYTVLAKGKGRADRRRIFAYVAERLRSPIYGYRPALSEDRTRRLLKMALHEAEKSSKPTIGRSVNANAM